MYSIIFRSIAMAVTVILTVLSTGLSIPEPDKPAVSILPVTGPESNVLGEPVTVNILQRLEGISFSLQQVLDLYSEKTANNVEFTVRTAGGDAGYNVALRSALLSGEGADMFMLSGARELQEYREHTAEINLSWANTAAAGSLDAVREDGKLFAVPYSLVGFGLICNRDMFEKAGVELSPNTSLRGMEDLNERLFELREAIYLGELKEDYPELEAVTEFAAGDSELLCGGFLDIMTGGAFEDPLAAAKADMETALFPAANDAEELLKLMARYSSSTGAWSGLAGVSAKDATERLAQGRVAAILADTEVYKEVNGLNPDLRGRLMLLPVPLGQYEQAPVFAGPSAYWAVNASTNDHIQKAAVDFLTWLYQSEEGTLALAERLGALSTYRETAKSTNAALDSQLLGYMNTGTVLPRYSSELDPAWSREAFAPAIRGYLTDLNKTWVQTLEDCGIAIPENSE